MIINLVLSDMINNLDFISIIVSFLLSIIWALIIFRLRPKLRINVPEFSKRNINEIEIPIENLSHCAKATKILVEVCIIYDRKTYHLKTEVNDFAFIPIKNKKNDNVRVFRTFKLSDYLTKVFPEISYENMIKYLCETDAKLRIRLHAVHSFSGLGKTFEEEFILKIQDNKSKIFERVQKL